MSTKFYVTDIACNEMSMVFACTGTDSNLHFWNQPEGNIKFLKSIATPMIQNRIWNLPKHNTWITSGRDYALNQWDINRDEPLGASIYVT